MMLCSRCGRSTTRICFPPTPHCTCKETGCPRCGSQGQLEVEGSPGLFECSECGTRVKMSESIFSNWEIVDAA